MSSWSWYGVKLLYECAVSGEFGADEAGSSDARQYRQYEESVVLIKAQSFEHAYRLAEKKAAENCIEYVNPYGETVRWFFLRSLDCFLIGEGVPKFGTEVYSRWIRVPNAVEANEFVRRFYPETDGEEDNAQ